MAANPFAKWGAIRKRRKELDAELTAQYHKLAVVARHLSDETSSPVKDYTLNKLYKQQLKEISDKIFVLYAEIEALKE